MKNNHCQDCIVLLCPGFIDDNELIECSNKKIEKQNNENLYCSECGCYHSWEREEKGRIL